MANVNRVFLLGRLTRDPERRDTPSGLAIASIGLAVNNFRKKADGSGFEEEPVFVDCDAFGRTAERATERLHKGDQVFIEGHLRWRQWESQRGEKRNKLSVTIDRLEILKGGRDEQGGGSGGCGAGGGSSYEGYGQQRRDSGRGSGSYGGNSGGGSGGYSRQGSNYDDYEPSGGDDDPPF